MIAVFAIAVSAALVCLALAVLPWLRNGIERRRAAGKETTRMTADSKRTTPHSRRESADSLQARSAAVAVTRSEPARSEPARFSNLLRRMKPDDSRPHPFGKDMAWIAVRTPDMAPVAQALGLLEPEAENWQAGIESVYDGGAPDRRVFVTPPVDGWVFVVGLALPHPVGRGFEDACLPLLEQLSDHFGEVQYFFTYPMVDLFAWARAENGRIRRAFAVGDEGTLWNKGRTTREEQQLGIGGNGLSPTDSRYGLGARLTGLVEPDSSMVLKLAGLWGIDPSALGGKRIPRSGYGMIGGAPSTWRARRRRPDEPDAPKPRPGRRQPQAGGTRRPAAERAGRADTTRSPARPHLVVVR